MWAYRTSKREATGFSPYSLTYGHDAVILIEIVAPSLRVVQQNKLSTKDYTQAMMVESESLEEEHMRAFDKIVVKKKKVVKAYNKRIKKKSFQEVEVVWKAVLPIGTKDQEF